MSGWRFPWRWCGAGRGTGRARVGAVRPSPVQGRLLPVQQENAIQTMELRGYFSLYCLHQEMQLVHVYLPLTSHILGAFVNSQIQGHKEVGLPASTFLPASLAPCGWPCRVTGNGRELGGEGVGTGPFSPPRSHLLVSHGA